MLGVALVLSFFGVLLAAQSQDTCKSHSAQDCILYDNCAVVNGSSCSFNSSITAICVSKECLNKTLVLVCATPHFNISNPIYYSFSVGCESLLPAEWTVVDPSLCGCGASAGLPLFQRIVPIVVLCFVVFFLIHPVELPIAKYAAKCNINITSFRIYLDFATVPIMGILTIMAAGTLTPHQVLMGIIGDDKIEPYAIIILFFALAYVCISLDVTGIFDYISLRAINATRGSGLGLFLAIFMLSSVLTLVTSNDIVILTLTPIICALSKFTGVDPRPLLFVQFFMANIWSIVLFIGNPTNIIVATAYKLTFIEYSQWMALPAAAAGLTCLLVLWIKFRTIIPPVIKTPNKEPSDYLKDRPGAIYGGICLFTCLGFLLGSAWLVALPMWGITLLFAFLLLVKDLCYDFLPCYPIPNQIPPSGQSNFNEKSSLKKNRVETVDDDAEAQEEADYFQPSINSKVVVKSYQTTIVLNRLPWKIIFFVFGVFITVEALEVAEWTTVIAHGLTTIIGTENAPFNIFVSVFLLGTLSVISCNILNNQPMTILFTNIIQSEAFRVGFIPNRGAMFALIMGSNLGANITLVGALAGIMWASILESRDIKISYLEFAKYGCTLMPPVVLVACGVLTAELCFFPQ